MHINNVSSLFYNLGRQLGRKAVPAIRTSKWIWDGVAGSEEDALKAEVSLGKHLATEFRANMPMSDDPEVAKLVGAICARVAACVSDERRRFQCEVTLDPPPTAIALPGGFLFISRSLAEFCECRPDELAFILGHEIAHVLLKHAWERMLSEASLRMVAAATRRVGPLGEWLRTQGVSALRQAHSQDAEMKADDVGLRHAEAAGFAVSGATAFFSRLQGAAATPAPAGSYFTSHPPAADRLARLLPLIRKLTNPG